MSEKYHEYHLSKETLKIIKENKLNSSQILANNNFPPYSPLPKNPNPDMPDSIGDLEEELSGP